jgi:phosphoglycerate dehydrogenase-like enzyme
VLHGKTLGVIGLGKLGRQITAYARAFGMDVIAWSPRLTDEHATASGARRVELDEVLAMSDVVTLHVALNAGSRGLIGPRELGLMKPSAYLINTSRGPIVDEAALVDAMRGGRIAGAGLDVYDREPVAADDPLVGLPNTVLLPHLGFVSRENMSVFYQDSADNIAAWLDGAPIRLVIA